MKYFAILFSLFCLLSCGQKQNEKKQKELIDGSYDKELEGAHQLYTMSEDEQISDYAMRQGWDMQKTGTGLRYLIYKKGNGKKTELETIARFSFTTTLINGFVCYDSSVDGQREILMGNAEVVSGLEEGLLLMHEGDKAKFIIPSHLAYGLLGDENKIPSKAILIYDVELIEVRNFNRL